ncbi:MAG: hypothetical protein NC131_05325 [Roseburia sp.]|nr:hypothetical protein [Roseburia sp.]
MGNIEYFTSSFSAFNKKTGYYEKDFLKNYDAWNGRYKFNEDIFKKVSADITNVLGDKKMYTGQEAYYYFHKRYFAFPIDYRQIYNYANVENVNFGTFDEFAIEDDGELDKFYCEVKNYFNYLRDGKLSDEKTITAVIDITNEVIKERFPEVKEYFDNKEKRLIDEYGSFERFYNGKRGYFCKNADGKIIPRCEGYSNIIIVIGSFDGKTINSMNVLQGDGFIEELGYAVEFFRRHC